MTLQACSQRALAHLRPTVAPRRQRRRVAARALVPDGALLDALHALGQHAPLALERVVYPCSSMNCGDAIYRSTLDPQLRMEASKISPWVWVLLVAAGAYLTATPGVLQGFFDTYVVAPLQRLTQPTLRKKDVRLGEKLAQGGFGTVYMGTSATTIPGKVNAGQKIVIKKAIEFGEAEVWMNERLSRAAPHAIATFLTAYADGPPAPGTPLVLVWKFEGKLSLDDAMQARDFPANVEELLLGRKLRIEDPVMRKLATIKVVVKDIVRNLQSIHRTGIVHRDVKPQNMILSSRGLKLIDLGAGADLRVGINYVPNEYLLDPRFAPPQQYVMSPLTPKAPPLPLAALLSPVLWRLNNPDRFDMYSVGVILMQLAFAPLRADSGLIAFNKRLEELNWDLGKWRAETARKKTSGFAEGFRIMDAEGGAAWELACGLLEYDQSERFSAARALKHRCLSGAATAETPMAAARRSVMARVDGAVNSVIDTKAFTSMRESMSEAELYAALAEDGSEDDKPPKDMPRTVAWWQSRARTQDLQGGVLGKLLRPGGGKQQRGGVGSATQRAFSSVDIDSSVDEHSSAGGNRGRSGAKSGGKRKAGGEESRVRGKGQRGGSGKEAPAPKAQKAGLFAMFGRKQS